MRTALLVGAAILASLFALSAIPAPVRAAGPGLSLSPIEGPPGTAVAVSGQGFAPGAAVDVVWHTMEGNRVSGSGFTEVGWTIATGTADAQGGLSASFVAPYDLGGPPHRIEAMAGGLSLANASFVLQRRAWISPTEGPEGTIIEVRMVAGGWTQYDNNVAITYDNAFLGFACSFNSQGNISVWVQAVGGAGSHVVGVYPALYYGPSEGPTPWKHGSLVTNDLPVAYAPELFTFTITESARGRSYRQGADLRPVQTPDSLLIPNLPAQAAEDGTPHLALGNGGTGIAGGDLPVALAGFPAGARVELRWNSYVGTTEIGGALNDKFLGWVFTDVNRTLGSVDVPAGGRASAVLRVPYDFGGAHTIAAVVGGEVLATAGWMTIPRFTASISADGSAIELHGSGLGWEKYTAVWNVLYDNQLMGWVSGMTTSGNVNASVPIVGGPGVHTIDVHEGSNAWPYLNMHQSPWPWEPVYRFAVTISEPPAPAPEASLPLWVAPLLAVVAAVIGFAVGRRRKSERAAEPGE